MEVDMFFKSKAPEKDKNAAANAAEVMGKRQHLVVEHVAASPTEVLGRTVQPHDQAWARSEPTTKAGTASCIGSDMSIVGNIECNGPAQVFGRIKGEVRASDLQISDGAQIEGSVIAQNVTLCGRVKGTIRAVRVKLHRSLSIDENSQFEGSSRRVENPTEIPSSIDVKIPQTTDTQSPTPMSNVDADLQRVESAPTDWSESTVGPKH
jgi:cytoskeletal protein CcmA (bactofilin family)